MIPVLEQLIAVDGVEKIPGRTFDSLAFAGTHVRNRKCLIRWLRHDERPQGYMREGCEFLEFPEPWQGLPTQPISKLRKLFDRFLVGAVSALESPRQHRFSDSNMRAHGAPPPGIFLYHHPTALP